MEGDMDSELPWSYASFCVSGLAVCWSHLLRSGSLLQQLVPDQRRRRPRRQRRHRRRDGEEADFVVDIDVDDDAVVDVVTLRPSQYYSYFMFVLVWLCEEIKNGDERVFHQLQD